MKIWDTQAFYTISAIWAAIEKCQLIPLTICGGKGLGNVIKKKLTYIRLIALAKIHFPSFSQRNKNKIALKNEDNSLIHLKASL